jgi:hypothetical protein
VNLSTRWTMSTRWKWTRWTRCTTGRWLRRRGARVLVRRPSRAPRQLHAPRPLLLATRSGAALSPGQCA